MKYFIDGLVSPRRVEEGSIEELNWNKLAAAGVIAGTLAAAPMGTANATEPVQTVIQVLGNKVDMSVIKQIESSGNPNAYNKGSQAIGLYQITPIVLEEWNNYHPNDKHESDDLYTGEINKKIAEWYMMKRIPQMIKHYGKEDSIQNRLIAYNAGIKYVKDGVSVDKLPDETQGYLEKYTKYLGENRINGHGRNIMKGIMGV